MFFLVGESRKLRGIKERFALVTEGKEGGKYGKLGDATALLNGEGRERPHAGEMEADKNNSREQMVLTHYPRIKCGLSLALFSSILINNFETFRGKNNFSTSPHLSSTGVDNVCPFFYFNIPFAFKSKNKSRKNYCTQYNKSIRSKMLLLYFISFISTEWTGQQTDIEGEKRLRPTIAC